MRVLRVRAKFKFRPRFERLAALSRRLVEVVRDERGAAAVFFAVATIVLAPLTLGVMDIYLASAQRNQLQDALDAATLFAARSTATSSSTPSIQTVGGGALSGNLQLPSGVSLVTSSFTLTGDTVVGYAETTPSALAPGLWAHTNIKANSTVIRSLDRLEVALVLDNTGSMAGTKLANLKTASNNLIDTLVAAAAKSTDPVPLRMSLVPFSMTVRVQGTTATTNYNTVTHSGTGFPTWIDPLAKADVALGLDTMTVLSDRFTLLKQMNKTPWEGCVVSRRQPYDIQETAPDPLTPATMFVPFFWPDEPDLSAGYSGYPNDYLSDAGTASWTWSQREKNQLKYTVASKTGTQSSTGYAYGPNGGCAMQPVIRLTANTASLKTAINAMVAVGDTNIPLGMMWGWHSLSPNAPFADGSAYTTQHLQKILILMTDGDNTMSDPSSSAEQNKSYFSGLGYIWQNILGITAGTTAQRQTAMDNRQAALCNNIKAKGVIIYTVRLEVTTGPSPVLQGCASTADKYYDVQDVSTLNAVFASIAGSINNLRIAH
jgi:Flp pilus assembly protein TadG